MTSYNELHDQGRNFSIDFPPDVAITIEDDSPDPDSPCTRWF